MGATQWAESVSGQVDSGIENQTSYAIQEYFFDFVRLRKYGPSEEFIRKIEVCAFNHGTTAEQVERMLAIVLRDRIMKSD